MILEGVKLMFVGMTTVMLFLVLMIFFINFIAFFTRGAASREVEAIKKERNALMAGRKNGSGSTDTDDNMNKDIAIITAAVATYEAERFAPV